MELNNTRIRLALQASLLGEVYSSIRAIVYKYNPLKNQIILRYYLDREPTDEDYGNISVVATEMWSHLPTEIDILDEECIYSNSIISELEILDGMVYCRKEN